MKVSLKLKGGTAVETEGGEVEVTGGSVTLVDKNGVLLLAYALIPGETVRQDTKGEYIVEF